MHVGGACRGGEGMVPQTVSTRIVHHGCDVGSGSSRTVGSWLRGGRRDPLPARMLHDRCSSCRLSQSYAPPWECGILCPTCGAIGSSQFSVLSTGRPHRAQVSYAAMTRARSLRMRDPLTCCSRGGVISPRVRRGVAGLCIACRVHGMAIAMGGGSPCRPPFDLLTPVVL